MRRTHLAASCLRRGAVEARHTWIGRRALGTQDGDFRAVWETTRQLPGFLPEHRARAMFAALIGVRPATIVEVGSYLGKSTIFLASAGRRASGGHLKRVVAIDPHTGDRQQLQALGAESIPSYALFAAHVAASEHADIIDARVSTSCAEGASWPGEEIDYLFIDGWHSYEAVTADGQTWLPFLSSHGVAVFDDIGYPDVRAAVHELADAGLMRLWGTAFGQAFGGKGEPPDLLRGILRASNRRWSRALGA